MTERSSDSEDVCTLALETLEDLYFVVKERQFHQWNRAVVDVTGYTDDELASMTVDAIILTANTETGGEPAVGIADGVATGEKRVTVLVETKTGERIPYELQLSRLSDDEHGSEAFAALGRDITERRNRERKLDQLRNQSHALMHTRTKTETAQVAVDAAHEIIGAPLSGIHLLNEDEDILEPSAVVSTVYDVFSDPPTFERGGRTGSRAGLVWSVLESGEPIHINSTHEYEPLTEQTPAGSVSIHPIGSYGVFIISALEPNAFDDTDRLLVEILADSVTAAMDRVKREQRNRQRERRLERLHKATRTLIRAKTHDEIANRVIEAAEEILGFSIMVVRLYDADAGGLVPISSSAPVADLLPTRDVFTPADGSLNWGAFEAGEPRRYDDIGTIDHAIDTDTPLRSLMILPLGEYGTLSVGELVAEAFDETDVFLARILATTAETALEAVDHKSTLRHQRDELEHQNERLQTFASIVSHDLRNPLNVASGHLELARDECESEQLEAIGEAHDRMETLISDLLMLARNGDAATDLVLIDFEKLVERCWRNVETADATLVVTTAHYLRANETRLHQLVENLIRNAVEHGGDTVTVTIGDLEDGFYVEDDGPGIPAEYRERVFETGFSTGEDGTGLGLSIVAEIATAHGWKLTVSEGTDGGARFECTGVDID